MFKKKLIMFSMVALILCAGVSTQVAYAQESSSDAVSGMQKLLEQIKSLQTQLEDLRKKESTLVTELQSTLALTRELRRGMSGDDVKRLQEILATDPTIYPEGIVSGTFGPLTEKAVKKFQQKFEIEQVGNVGPKTLSQLNKILQDGAGNSGKVPPGLLVAPGIAKKLGYQPMPLPGQKLPPGIAKKLGVGTSTGSSTPDTTAPAISNVSATSTASTSAIISWTTNENATGIAWYSTSTPVVTATASKTENLTLKKNHSLTLSSLAATTTYYYVVSSKDSSGNTATSSQYSITTLGQ